MHWTEWAAMLLLILFAIPVVYLIIIVSTILWACVVELFTKREEIEIGKKCQTPVGEFTRDSFGWVRDVEINGAEIDIRADDVYGEPNPLFLQELPSILDNLAQLERTARQTVDSVDEQYSLSGITDSKEAGQFTLIFSGDIEHWKEAESETLFVDFEDNEVVDWTFVF